mgnify:CR=1 FL=1
MAQQNTDMLDGLQAVVLTDAQKKKENTQEYKFDPLKMYFREDYFVNGIRIVQPTIGDILNMGESKFYSDLSPFLYNSTSIRVMLWDLPQRIDWCKVKDIEVFGMLKGVADTDNSAIRLLFPDYRIEHMQLIQFQEKDSDELKLCLYDEENEFVLKESEYMEIAEYIRTLLNIHPKVEKAKGKTAKKWMIDEDRMNIVQRKDKNTSTLLPLISACVNHPGFKYKLQELRNVGIYEFMDSVQRLQIYESTHALLGGSYSGFADMSKISKDQFNFMRELYV